MECYAYESERFLELNVITIPLFIAIFQYLILKNNICFTRNCFKSKTLVSDLKSNSSSFFDFKSVFV